MTYTVISPTDLDKYIENGKEIYLVDKRDKTVRNLNTLLFYTVNEVIKHTEISKNGRYEFFVEE